MSIRELGHWLEHSNDADTLQGLTGSFNHLSPSVRAHLMSGARPHAICSFIDGHRFSRPRSIRDYEQWLDTYEVESRTSTSEGDSTDDLVRHDWLLDLVMVRRC